MWPRFGLVLALTVLTTVFAGGAQHESVGAPAGAGLDVIVVRPDGSPALGLAARDFVVVSNGRERMPVRVVPNEQPVSLYLLLDVSLSSTWRMFAPIPGPARPVEPPLRRLQEVVAKSFIRVLRTGDRGRIGMFGSRLLSTPAYADATSLGRAFQELFDRLAPEDRMGPTPIWDLVDEAIPQADLESPGRALILLSDGQSTESSSTVASAAHRANGAGLPISVVSLAFDLDVPQADGTFVSFRPNSDLRSLADLTGGLFIFQGRTTPYKSGSGLPKDSDRIRLNNDRWLDPTGPIEHVTRAHQNGYTLFFADHSEVGEISEVRVKRSGLRARVLGARVPSSRDHH